MRRQQESQQQQQNMSQAQEMMMRHSLSEFQGQQTEVHNRQESTDSGLGMGSNCNLGIIQEDMVMENMDTQDLDTTLTAETGGQTGTPSQGGMETEELMPSLQGL